MAIYYIDPHTTTNGTGTYASPWSFSTATRTGLASNDEIRIKGVALTSLLTATSYTATVTSNYQLTITAGGGLGADWAVGNVGYLPAYDTFFKVYAVTTNVVSIYTTTSMLPILNWSATTVTLRRVDTTTYPVSTTTNYVMSSTGTFTGITISDCWIDATTRVTDGTVKTLLNTSSTGSAIFYPVGANVSTVSSGWTLDLANTHAVCSTGTSSGYVDLNLSVGYGHTITINQLQSWGSSGSGIAFNTGCFNNTINITKFNSYYGFGPSITGQNNTINVTYLNTYTTDIFGSSGGINSQNNTFNITNYSFNVTTNSSALSFVNSAKNTINITGTIDQYGSTASTYIVAGFGDVEVNIGASVVYYYNKRVSTKTAFTAAHFYSSSGLVGDVFYVPKVNRSNAWSVTNESNVTTWLGSYPKTSLPQAFSFVYPTNSRTTNTPNGVTGPVNVLMTFKDGTSPQEILGVFGNGTYANSTGYASYPLVTTDAAVYRTTGPSLKSTLTTKTAGVWSTTANNTSKGTKTIKIPCTSGVSYTVSGYVRTDETSYTNGDCRVGIWFNDAEVTGQDMTTACENAWEQFTLTFTATQTAEYVFTWSMFYPNGAKSYWLDDLTIA